MIREAGAHHPALAAYRHVGEPGWLAERGLFVAEGRLVVERLLSSEPGYQIDSIVLTPSAARSMSAVLQTATCDVYVCERGVLEDLTGFDFHRGCLAIARRPAARPVERLVGLHRLVGLEGVGNPDNVGGIFRAAAALQGGGVLLDGGSADPFYRKAIRTSMGATLTLPWARSGSWRETLDQFRQAGWRIVALTPSEPATSLADFAATGAARSRLLLLVGAEGAGLSEQTLHSADERVRIPIERSADSLNVVVAAAIALERLR